MNALQQVGELDRTTYIGGSDSAAIICMSDWGTPLSAYMDKIGEGEPPSEEKLKFFEGRKEAEPFVLKRLVRERGVNIVAVNHRYRHPLHNFIAAEIDFEFEVTPEVIESCPGIPAELVGTIQNGEIKTSHFFAGAKFGDEGTDEIPIQYCAQSMHGLMVTDRKICLYAVMTGFDQFATYVLHRDQETIDGLLQKEVNFWNEHVLKRVPPEPIDNDDLMILFKKHNGLPVELDERTATMHAKLKELRAEAKLNEENQDEIKFQIGLFVARQWGLTAPEAAEDNAILQFNGEKIGSWNKQARSGINAKALAKAQPKIAAEFQKTSYFRVIR